MMFLLLAFKLLLALVVIRVAWVALQIFGKLVSSDQLKGNNRLLWALFFFGVISCNDNRVFLWCFAWQNYSRCWLLDEEAAFLLQPWLHPYVCRHCKLPPSQFVSQTPVLYFSFKGSLFA